MNYDDGDKVWETEGDLELLQDGEECDYQPDEDSEEQEQVDKKAIKRKDESIPEGGNTIIIFVFFANPVFSFIGISVMQWKVFKNRNVNQNDFFYRLNRLGETVGQRDWTEEERKLFFNRLEQVGPHKWGLFSYPIPGRVGYQCQRYYHNLLASKEVKPSMYPTRSYSKEELKRIRDEAKSYTLSDLISYISKNKDPSESASKEKKSKKTKKSKKRKAPEEEEDIDSFILVDDDLPKEKASPSKRKKIKKELPSEVADNMIPTEDSPKEKASPSKRKKKELPSEVADWLDQEGLGDLKPIFLKEAMTKLELVAVLSDQ